MIEGGLISDIFSQWLFSQKKVPNHYPLLFKKKFKIVQLRDPKNDFIFNFNFEDKMKNL